MPAFNLGYLLRAGNSALANTRQGTRERQEYERQMATDESTKMFSEWAKRRQLDTDDATVRQRESAALALAGFREEQNELRRLIAEQGSWINRATAGQGGTVDRTNQSRGEQNTSDNQTALEIARIRAQMAGQGKSAAAERAAAIQESRLAGQFGREQPVKNAVEIGSRLSQIQAAGDNAAGDLSLIFGYMKILDPTSVVREGEQASAANTRGVPDTIRVLYNRILSGDKLSPEQRVQFRSEALKIAKAQNISLDDVKRRYGAMSRRAGADSATVVGDPYVGLLDQPGAGRPPEPDAAKSQAQSMLGRLLQNRPPRP